jgi:kynurenine formamidase
MTGEAMKIIDISGPVYTGMWSYADYYPKFELAAVEFEFGGEKYSVDVFKGMHAQVGTYIESPNIFEGVKKEGGLSAIPVEKLFMIDSYIYRLDHESLPVKDGRPYVTAEDLIKAEKGKVEENSAILVGTGYGKNWDSKDYIDKAWFFSKDALYYIIDKKPFLLGGDSPVWENAINPEGAFERFYKSGILLFAPCINLEKVSKFKAKLTVLPLKILNAAVCPVRAVIAEE